MFLQVQKSFRFHSELRLQRLNRGNLSKRTCFETTVSWSKMAHSFFIQRVSCYFNDYSQCDDERCPSARAACSHLWSSRNYSLSQHQMYHLSLRMFMDHPLCKDAQRKERERGRVPIRDLAQALLHTFHQ